MWDVISAISGAVSAICDIRDAQGRTQSKNEPATRPARSRGRSSKGLGVLLRLSIGWVLLVTSYIWIAQPFGAFISDGEQKQILGWIVAGPALLVILGALARATGG